MKYIAFFLSLAFTIATTVFLNSPIKTETSDIPPLGKILNPFTGFWANAESTTDYKDQQFNFKALTNKVEVVYDENNIPHIFADNLDDAFFVQGYITAQHRLWQLDISTRAASGRLSEIMGEKTLKMDMLERRKGMVYGAENTLAGWKKHPEDFNKLQKYTDGVNAYISSLEPADYPIEFKLLNYEPEPWTNLKSALFIKSMAKSLCMREDDLESTNSLTVFGKETFDFLFPDYNPKQSPIIPSDTEWTFDPKPVNTAQPVLMGLFQHEPFEKPAPFIGSNNWAVSGAKTKSGNPILCNDPHLGLTLPAIWFEVQITTPEGSSYGVSLPGFPGVIIGFNEHISWGSTNVGHDVLDYYQIVWADDQHTKYILDDQVKPVRFIYEVYQVKDKPPVIDTVAYTDWGPILYDDPEHPMHDLAMRWLAHDGGSNELSVFRKWHTSKNFDDFYDAVQEFMVPPQNLIYAGKNGEIGIKVQGKFPLKRPGQGRFIQDGSNSNNGWQGFVPREHNPQSFNPQRQFVSSANQHSTDTTYPYYYHGGFEDFRGRTLNELLDSMTNITPKDMMDLQNNNFSSKAADALPLFLKYLNYEAKNTAEEKILDQIMTWDYNFDKDLIAPILFNYWFDSFYTKTWDEFDHLEDSLNVKLLYPESWRTIALLEEQADHAFFDNIKSKNKIETAADIVNASFAEAISKLNEHLKDDPDYNLSKHKSVSVPHLGRIPAFASFALDVGGDGTALNAIKKRGTTIWGPSWRMIVEMEKRTKGFGVYPGGQSGNPGSPFYDNMVEQWASGKYYEKYFLKSPELPADKTLYRATFNQ